MLQAGDEMRRTQGGNSNAYCQDNATSWVDWSLLRRNDEVFQFLRTVLALRRGHRVLRRGTFYADTEVVWFGSDGRSVDWEDPGAKCVGCVIGEDTDEVCLLFNASNEPASFVLPRGPWSCSVDTARATLPGDLRSYGLAPRSSAMLVGSAIAAST